MMEKQYNKQWAYGVYCLWNQIIEGQRELCEAGGSSPRVPLFLIDTKTQVITQIESAYEGERLGLGPRGHLSHFSKRNCLNRVQGCLVGRSEEEVKNKFKDWLLIPGNSPIILELPEGAKQSALIKLAKVNQRCFGE